jgi:hypothetical protein
MRDQAIMTKLKALLGIEETDTANARWKIQRAIETGEIVTIPDLRRSSGACGSHGIDMPKPRSVTFTPSQLFKGAPRISSAGSFGRPAPIRLFADDCMAAWLARPGDVLPDGRIATAVGAQGGSTLQSLRNVDDDDALGDAAPFEYQPDSAHTDAFDIASQETKTPNTGDSWAWYTNPGSGQMRLYGDTGAPVIDLDFDHVHNGLRPHAHNWNDGVRDGGDDVVPFSPWKP